MKDKNIIIGVTGGIAVYKIAELIRILVKEGVNINVAMTASATRFVTPLTFETLSGNRVVSNMFDPGTAPLDHIKWGQESDLVIIAPATANFISKMAHGIADDFLSTMVLASTVRMLVCPSMNNEMYLHPAVQENIKRIKERGCEVMKPGEGELACDSKGPGRLPEPEEIAEQARILLSKQDLSGLNILVTAGPTIEPLDPVRYLTNRSTGKMGFAVARAAGRRGASVTLVSGPTMLAVPYGIKFLGVTTAQEMRQAVLENSSEADIVIKAAAVSDYKPRENAAQKIKKGAGSITIDLVNNPDILAELGEAKGENGPILVGFAAETEDLLSNATEKLRKKNLDMIVANDVTRNDAGFQSETNLVKILYSSGEQEDLPLMTKDDLADHILDRLKIIRKGMS